MHRVNLLNDYGLSGLTAIMLGEKVPTLTIPDYVKHDVNMEITVNDRGLRVIVGVSEITQKYSQNMIDLSSRAYPSMQRQYIPAPRLPVVEFKFANPNIFRHIENLFQLDRPAMAVISNKEISIKGKMHITEMNLTMPSPHDMNHAYSTGEAKFIGPLETHYHDDFKKPYTDYMRPPNIFI